MNSKFQVKIKDKIINELNEGLYLHLNMDLYDADHFFGYYNGFIYKIIDRVSKNGFFRLFSRILAYLCIYLIYFYKKKKR